MKIAIWYLFVVLDFTFLIISILSHNIYFTIFCFIIALILNKFKKDIPLPKQFESLNIIHKNK
ncbi:hypothetical protein Clopa_3768 [Clostridium pasteurianum BC1]|uniref:Uncharacterized protein n=1 Tax=Clostridium pasteurianum BC1 TaxID=86416 RepID=R4K5V9_CLOPA|nr:hypothetical protein Clopa_3768 [Clostridium pasteurianum BC1]